MSELPVRRVTVLGTTDLHARVRNWDYYRDREYDDLAHRDVGLAKIATLVRRVRAARPAGTTLTLDAGDTIQGTPLASFYATVDPVDAPGGPVHPMAAAMNAVGYDAACLGNHEFNYGTALLDAFVAQCNHPVLGANVLEWGSDRPAFPSHVLRTVRFPGTADEVTVGIVGLVTPGCAIWDRSRLAGRLAFTGVVERGHAAVAEVRAAGADVVVVLCHSGATPSSSYGDALPWPENAAQELAEQVPGIDAVLVGHAHVEIAQRTVTNAVTGRPVLLCEPLCWGMRLAVIDLDLAREAGRWAVVRAASTLLAAETAEEDPEIVRVTATAHRRVREHVNRPVGTARAPMTTERARYQDTPALAFVNRVQAAAVRAALTEAGDPAALLPVVSVAAPFSRSAAVPAGQISVRDVASLYVFDNTLVAVRVTGAQLRDYLEYSARYFRPVRGTGPFRPSLLCNAPAPHRPTGIPDYDYDVAHGLDAPLTYEIDLGRPAGDRLAHLAHAGAAMTDDELFVLATNDYRRSGAGAFPHVATAPLVYDGGRSITELLVEHVTAAGGLDPAAFAADHWRLTFRGEPLIVADGGGR